MKPNKDENRGIEYLQSIGYKDIIYEPDGNIPPDLLVENRIAIEVRRLNQNKKLNGKLMGLEQGENSIYSWITKVIQNVSDQNFTTSAFVSYSFRRPYPDKKELLRWITSTLNQHKTLIDNPKDYYYSDFDDSFELSFYPAGKKLQNQFVIGMTCDSDSGGFMVGELFKNINFIIEEKERKISKFKGKYQEWWLMLINRMDVSLNNKELEQLKSSRIQSTAFDKVLLVSGLPDGQSGIIYECS